ncbi:hypothetical protein [uncultured Microbulbifer sp.]|uniref:hypothetical protein n=1 Tax=uncultured Microbulbifer sp. TaxID=348147 RepID=UPI0026388F01|nr:hypothetical protein [uncultured Microbulbifer sp.]
MIIDQKEISCLKNKGFFEAELESANHTVFFDKRAWESDKDLRTNISSEAGELYFYEYGQIMTGMFAAPGSASVSGAEDFYRKTREHSVAMLKLNHVRLCL